MLDIGRDAGQIRRVDKQRALAEEIARKDKAFEALCHSVSHDLRAPLRTIDGFSQALLEDCADKLDATGHFEEKGIEALCFSPDGNTLATATKLTTTTSGNGTLEKSGDVDMYQFTMNQILEYAAKARDRGQAWTA